MVLAVQIERNGGPEEMRLVQVQVRDPGKGEVRVRHHAIGLNFIDVYQRSGLYQLPGHGRRWHCGGGGGRRDPFERR